MNIIEKIKDYFAHRRYTRIKTMSEELFQIKEFNGEIWFTYSGRLVCPAKMLNGDAVSAVSIMRDLYVKRTY